MLIVGKNEKDSSEISSIIKGDDVNILTAKTAKEALALMSEKRFDCLVMDPALPDSSGFDIIKSLDLENGIAPTSVVVRHSKNLTKKRRNANEEICKSCCFKREKLIGTTG